MFHQALKDLFSINSVYYYKGLKLRTILNEGKIYLFYFIFFSKAKISIIFYVLKSFNNKLINIVQLKIFVI